MAHRLVYVFCAMLGLASMSSLGLCGSGKDGGSVVYPGRNGSPGPVLFSHAVHLAAKFGYKCSRCHPADSARTQDGTMPAIRQGKACGSCHNGKSETAAAGDCSACHMPAADIVIRLNRMDPVAFSHRRHLKAEATQKTSYIRGLSCGDCHSELFERVSGSPVGMEVPHESGGCAKCHNGKQRTDGMSQAFPADTRCLTCHKPPA